jgi:hypothetical protein
MSPRPWKERIEDILEAIAEIQEFTRGMTLNNFGTIRRRSRPQRLISWLSVKRLRTFPTMLPPPIPRSLGASCEAYETGWFTIISR